MAGDDHSAGAASALWQRLRGRLQPDPRRWTVMGWVNAAYVALGAALGLAVDGGDDRLSPTIFWGLMVAIVVRAGFEWWWNRRRQDLTAEREP
jgi:hypothetical protein